MNLDLKKLQDMKLRQTGETALYAHTFNTTHVELRVFKRESTKGAQIFIDWLIASNNQEVLHITSAYGRLYKGANELWKAWFEGKDFKFFEGPYFSRRNIDQLRDMGYSTMMYTQPNDDNIYVFSFI